MVRYPFLATRELQLPSRMQMLWIIASLVSVSTIMIVLIAVTEPSDEDTECEVDPKIRTGG